ncbi:hypothetical protein EVAR_22792_1 [Eumeta japonica]|uniref:Uncharacterized protein n=1 Tax=Eumeta variegata TaxID=151549 RepID=A0A4C1VG78_EUMVA|nr:hypothetical protein EVAR_22792_1 [Eumeta japonica]
MQEQSDGAVSAVGRALFLHVGKRQKTQTGFVPAVRRSTSPDGTRRLTDAPDVRRCLSVYRDRRRISLYNRRRCKNSDVRERYGLKVKRSLKWLDWQKDAVRAALKGGRRTGDATARTERKETSRRIGRVRSRLVKVLQSSYTGFGARFGINEAYTDWFDVRRACKMQTMVTKEKNFVKKKGMKGNLNKMKAVVFVRSQNMIECNVKEVDSSIEKGQILKIHICLMGLHETIDRTESDVNISNKEQSGRDTIDPRHAVDSGRDAAVIAAGGDLRP